MDAIDTVKAAIIAELKRQAPNVYFWDRADEDLFEDGPVTRTEFGPDTEIIFMANKFNMYEVAAAAVQACRDWQNNQSGF